MLAKDVVDPQQVKRKASEDGWVTIEELRGYEEALSSELEALLATLSNRESMSREDFDRHMSGVHELEARLQSVRWDIELSKFAVSNALLSNKTGTNPGPAY